MTRIVLLWVCLLACGSMGSTVSAAETAGATFEYADKGKRDPFLSLVTPDGVIVTFDEDLGLADLMLEGIVAGAGGRNIAIINGVIVNPQDRIGPYEVLEIQADAVILKKGPQTVTLKLKKED